MFRIVCYVISAILLLNCLACQQGRCRKTEGNTSDNWTLLFDGSSLEQWQSSTTVENISICWQIQDGELLGIPKSKRPKDAHASLLTKKRFSNFELEFEFKLEAPTKENATNGGVKYFVYPNTELGLEFQLYARVGEIPGPYATADLYDIFAATGAQLRPFDEWNSARIVSHGNMCEHWLNGTKVLVYERGGQSFRAAIARSKFKDREGFGELQAGHIMLQDYTGGVGFRNIRIREL